MARAVHEAGHAVAALAVGGHAESANILAGDGETVTCCHDEWAAVTMAGTAACDLLGFPTGSHRDEVVAAVGQAEADRAYARAAELLRPRKLSILVVAHQLVAREELTGEEIQEMLAVSG